MTTFPFIAIEDVYRAIEEAMPTPPTLQSPLLEVGSMARPKRNKGYTPPEAQPYCGTREASEILGVSVTVVKRLAKRGDIPSAYLVDNKFYIMLRSEVIELKQKRDE